MIERRERTQPALAGSYTDAASVVEAALTEARQYAAEKLHRSLVEVRGDLAAGANDAHGYFRYALARALAGYLARLDKTVRAVYLYADDVELSGQPLITAPVSLLIWAERRTAALSEMAAALNASLAGQYREMVGSAAGGLQTLLQAAIASDGEVYARTGAGAMIGSIFAPPTQVWGDPPLWNRGIDHDRAG